MNIEISAPGKTILHGEHAVVFGKAAIAMSLSLRTRLQLVSPKGDKVTLELSDIDLIKEWDVDELNNCRNLCSDLGAGDVAPANDECVQKIIQKFKIDEHTESEKLSLATFLYLWIHISKCYNDGDFPSCHIKIESDVSIGSGMGSSASYSVCLSTAILILCGRITPSLLSEDKELINKWAFQAERIFHGKPSGIDNSICTFGGALLFKDGNISEVETEIQNIRILLADTQVSRNTKFLVQAVKEKQQLYPAIIDPVLEAIDAISINCWKILKQLSNSKDLEEKTEILQDFICMNQNLLNCLDIGHEKLKEAFSIAEEYSCPAKLTGAGGGGCAIIMIPPKQNSQASSLKDKLLLANFLVWDIFLGHPGVQIKFGTA